MPLFIATSALLGSCSSSFSKVSLPYGQLYDASLKDSEHLSKIEYSELKSYMNVDSSTSNLSFLLVIQGNSSGCLCWSDFQSNLNTFMSHYNAKIYVINYSEFSNKDYLGFDVQKSHDTLAVVSKGSVAAQKVTSDSEDTFVTDYDTLKSWLLDKVSFSSMLYLNKNQLDTLLGAGSPLVVGFVRSSCGDCSYLLSHDLITYNQKEHATSYLFECEVEGVYLSNGATPNENSLDGNQAAINWGAFKDKYGLSNANNLDFGYETGYVPTFIYYLGNNATNPALSIRDEDVYTNDSLTKNDDGTYKVSASYFDGSRDHEFILNGFKGTSNLLSLTSLPAEQVNVSSYGVSWKHEYSAIYHDALLEAFLSFYLD